MKLGKDLEGKRTLKCSQDISCAKTCLSSLAEGDHHASDLGTSAWCFQFSEIDLSVSDWLLYCMLFGHQR